ncbi:MAG: electron transport complex subunit RsxC [Pseudomonadota bacterium]|nr:electron transport complex subunit RsxC [Pseudomonadota bacterium]
MGLLNLFHKSFDHGVHPPDYKEQTADQPIRRLPFPPQVMVPLAQHIGKPAVPLVRKGQEVVRGEPIARADGFMSVPHHAPVTGVVTGIELTPTVQGPKSEAIVIRAHPGAGQNILYGDFEDLASLSREMLIERVQETGMVGLGGAAFPTHVKLSVPEGHAIDTLIANGCECEPYLTSDHRIMVEKFDQLIRGVALGMQVVGAKQAIIGVEDNKADAYRVMRKQLPKNEPIRILPLRTKYPQGAEKMLIQSATGREVPSGGFPYQIGILVQNVSTLALLGELMPVRHGLIERVVTITGPGIRKPGNYLVAVGTPLSFVLQQLGYSGGANHLILGGPMMGMSVASLEVPVTKAVSGILVLTEEEEKEQEAPRIWPCIKCGHCLEACPLHLNPSQLGMLAAVRQYEAMEQDYHLNDCFECGSCSYVCPSGIPLVQYFRIAKALNRDRRLKEAESA